MGALCACASSKKPSIKTTEQSISIISESFKTQVSNVSESTISIHSSDHILDDDFRARITDAIDVYIVSIPIVYQIERDRIVNEMDRSASDSYLGLVFSNYSDAKGLTMNGMARRLVTFNETKQWLTDQINEHIQTSFASRTADWNSISRETARLVVKTFVEKRVNDALKCVELV
ncbi:unnamed protein product [Rotaria sp. Silwood1]|nr:unnamed protein product [Rotaria sp. Silwood1]CAF3450404.1 unnamed protein product [Rotaria sp. Silwood1]CAF4522399.1 unnamed protein product [Rotaria sp. Silwood1]CAF4799682.1 unnamed protein product [Rotaria sp. Silwood1]